MTTIQKPKVKLTIPGQLPGLNEYILAERGNRYAAAKMKQEAETRVCWEIKSQLKGVTFLKPVQVSYLWIEPNRRRDKDNIAFARKFIQDALVEMNVLKGDGWKHIEGFSDSFEVGAPRVEIEITET